MTLNMKRCSTSYAIRKMQVKTTMTYLYIPVRMVEIQNTGSNCCW